MNTLEHFIGNTPLVKLQRIPAQFGIAASNTLLGKLEGNNPAGSVKDRPAMSMISRAEARGDIKPGDTLVEATSGNTGIALAMAAAIKGYKMVLEVEKCPDVPALKALALRFVELLQESQGEAAARQMREALGSPV